MNRSKRKPPYEKLKRGELDEIRNFDGSGRLLVALRIAQGLSQCALADLFTKVPSLQNTQSPESLELRISRHPHLSVSCRLMLPMSRDSQPPFAFHRL